MRGRTLANAFVILDEAQNTTPAQMKMFLTRFGENSRMVICGDPPRSTFPGGDQMSGLKDAVERLEGVEGIAVIRFTDGDVVRHPIVGRIVEAYEGEEMEAMEVRALASIGITDPYFTMTGD
jgi:phosphate starvation-inducible PhoH-like protein